MNKNKLTQKELVLMLNYNSDTGLFKWRCSGSGRKADGSAGTVDSGGYLVIKIKQVLYKAHRLAWLYVYGKWPEDQVDHINRIKKDNRIKNLRVVSAVENKQNMIEATASNKSTGVLGVTFVKRTGKFRALLRFNGKQNLIGDFETVEAAKLAYNEAKIKNHPKAKHLRHLL